MIEEKFNGHTDAEIIREYLADRRNLETAQEMQQLWSNNKLDAQQQTICNTIVDMVVPELLKHDRFGIITLPASLVLQEDDSTIPVIAYTTRLNCFIEDSENYYDSMIDCAQKLQAEYLTRMETCRVWMYYPIGFTEVADPIANVRRFGGFTRFAKLAIGT